MDKIVLSSERTFSDCSNFAVGIFQDDELHLTPMKAMLHMKQQCDYLDEKDKHVRGDGSKGAGEGKRGFLFADLSTNIIHLDSLYWTFRAWHKRARNTHKFIC